MAAPDTATGPKLASVWGFVLLRGLIEGALGLLFLVPGLQEADPMRVFVGATLCGGSLVELAMAYRLGGHTFRKILVFVGVSGLLIGGFLFYSYAFKTVTLKLLVILIGLWVALRGFAALWLGLSIISGTFARAVPILAGLGGLVAGGVAMVAFTPESNIAFIRLVAIYGLVSVVVHVLVAFRMRADRRRHMAAQKERSADEKARAVEEV